MILMIIWIARILYDSGIIEHYFEDISDKTSTKSVPHQNGSLSSVEEPQNFSSVKLSLNGIYRNFVTRYDNYGGNRSDDFDKLKHAEYGPWLSLSAQHWPAVLRKYNVSLAGRSVAILPAIRISHPVGPEQAVLLRHPEDSFGQKFQWQALAAALDPIDFSGMFQILPKKTTYTYISIFRFRCCDVLKNYPSFRTPFLPDLSYGNPPNYNPLYNQRHSPCLRLGGFVPLCLFP